LAGGGHENWDGFGVSQVMVMPVTGVFQVMGGNGNARTTYFPGNA
jgi:hypothetical protein